MIPKILHQTWKSEKIPEDWKPLVSSWKKHHPDWQYMYWTNESGLDFVVSRFPDFIEVYKSYSYDIQRADALRYLLLTYYGGLYVDMDFECLRPFDKLIASCQLLIGLEPNNHAQQFGLKSLMSNALIASTPQHPFWSDIIQHLQNKDPYALTHNDILSSTGPIMIQEVFDSYLGNDISVAPSYAFYPFTNNAAEFDILGDKQAGTELRKELINKDCYAIHYWANTWMRNLAGDLKNLNPYDIPGYRFFPSMDSHGNDLQNGGRNIKVLSEICSEMDGADGFNTDGFIKSHIFPKDQWVKMKISDGNEGLYVKNTRIKS